METRTWALSPEAIPPFMIMPSLSIRASVCRCGRTASPALDTPKIVRQVWPRIRTGEFASQEQHRTVTRRLHTLHRAHCFGRRFCRDRSCRTRTSSRTERGHLLSPVVQEVYLRRSISLQAAQLCGRTSTLDGCLSLKSPMLLL